MSQATTLQDADHTNRLPANTTTQAAHPSPKQRSNPQNRCHTTLSQPRITAGNERPREPNTHSMRQSCVRQCIVGRAYRLYPLKKLASPELPTRPAARAAHMASSPSCPHGQQIAKPKLTTRHQTRKGLPSPRRLAKPSRPPLSGCPHSTRVGSTVWCDSLCSADGRPGVPDAGLGSRSNRP
jgi:hypothetical protein